MTIVGIQGGRGSFNHSAIKAYQSRSSKKLDVRYLHTTEAVLEALERGEIELGQFAIFNTVFGLYEESLEAMSRYVFEILDRHYLRIQNALMIRGDADPRRLRTVVTHPQSVRITFFGMGCRSLLG